MKAMTVEQAETERINDARSNSPMRMVKMKNGEYRRVSRAWAEHLIAEGDAE